MRRLRFLTLFTSMETLLTASDIRAILGVARSTFYTIIRDSDFPSPIKINSRTYRWHRSEIELWLKLKQTKLTPIKKTARASKSNFHVVNGVRFRKYSK